MPDRGDYVSDLVHTLNTTALAHHRQQNAPRVKDSLDDCVNCGALIPSARQVAAPGCELCIECAAFMEQHGRLP